MFPNLWPSIELFFTIQNLFVVAAGLFIGITIGAIPGLNVPMTVALLLPITFYMSPVAGLSLLIGAAYIGLFGFTMQLGAAERLEPALAAWLPNAVFGVAGLLLFFRTPS